MATKKVFTNTLAQIGGKIATALISIFMIKIMTNYMDIEGYGLYSKIYNYLSIFSVIADLGLYTISVREMSRHRDDPLRLEQIAGTILTMRTGLGILIVFIALLLGFWMPGYDSKVAMIAIAIAGIFTLFGLMNSSILSMLQAFLKTEFSFVSVTVGKIVNFLWVLAVVFVIVPKPFGSSLILGLTQEEFGFVLLFVAGLLGNLVMTLLLYLYAKRLAPVGFHWDFPYMRKLLKETLPYGLALFLNVIFFKVDVVLLSLLEPLGSSVWRWDGLWVSFQAPHLLADHIVALYSLPMKIVEVGMMFGTVFLNSMLPLLSIAIAKTDRDGGKELGVLVYKGYRILLFFWVGTAVFMTLLSGPILRLIASSDYLVPLHGYSSADVLSIVGFIFLFYFVSSLFTYLLIASGKQSRLLRINAWIAGLNLVANAIVIPYYSFMGSAVITLVCQAVLLGFMIHGTRDVLRFDFAVAKTLTILGFAILAGSMIWFVQPQIQALVLGWSHGIMHTVGYGLTVLISGMLFSIVYVGGVGSVEWLGRRKS